MVVGVHLIFQLLLFSFPFFQYGQTFGTKITELYQSQFFTLNELALFRVIFNFPIKYTTTSAIVDQQGSRLF